MMSLIGLNLDINDVRGQGYDNGSNVKGKKQSSVEEIVGYQSNSVLYTMWLT